MSRAIKQGISGLVRGWDSAGAMVRGLWGGKPPGVGVVLYYHAIERSERDAFERQMEEVRRWATPVPTGYRGQMEAGGLYAAVSFDDGFISVIENALPVLERLKIPATMFVPTGSLGGPPKWIRDAQSVGGRQRVMTEDELRGFRGHPILTMGSHSIRHPNFRKLSESEARNEFLESRLELERIMASPVREFSFPHGSHNAALLRWARECGYERVFTVLPRLAFRSADEFATGRVLVDPSDTPTEFRLKLMTAYRWMAWVTAMKARLAGAPLP